MQTNALKKSQLLKEEKNEKNLTDEDDDELVQTVYTVEPTKLNRTPIQYQKESMQNSTDKIKKVNTKLNLIPKEPATDVEKRVDKLEETKPKKLSQREISQNLPDAFVSLVSRVENIFKEWVTDDTVKLLVGDDVEKQSIFDRVMHNER